MYGSCRGRLRRSRHFPCERRQMSNEETSVSVRRSNNQVAMFARRAKITLRDAGRRDGPRGAMRDENLSGDVWRACNKRYKVAYQKIRITTRFFDSSDKRLSCKMKPSNLRVVTLCFAFVDAVAIYATLVKVCE